MARISPLSLYPAIPRILACNLAKQIRFAPSHVPSRYLERPRDSPSWPRSVLPFDARAQTTTLSVRPPERLSPRRPRCGLCSRTCSCFSPTRHPMFHPALASHIHKASCAAVASCARLDPSRQPAPSARFCVCGVSGCHGYPPTRLPRTGRVRFRQLRSQIDEVSSIRVSSIVGPAGRS